MKNKILLLAFIVYCLSALQVQAQGKENPLQNLNVGKEYFYLDPLVFYPLDSSVGRLDVYIEIPLENLQFKKAGSNDNYEASFDLRIIIKNFLDQQIFTQTYSEKINSTKNEQKNISEQSVSNLKNYYLKSGFYKINFSLKDKNSGNEYIKDFSVNVRDPKTDRILASDIMLLSDYSVDSKGEQEITPLISGNIGTIENFYIFSEIQNNTDEVVTKVFRIVSVDDKEKVMFDTTISVNIKKGKNPVIVKMDAADYSIGSYTLKIFEGSKVLTETNFVYRWGDVPITVKDLDEAVSQLQYIATTKELDYINDAANNEEKLKRFVRFWKSIDPSPRTPKNEIMIEYYNRIKIANERYSHYTEGWKTDMGMVFIIYGNPSVIDRHPFESDSKPYEIWTYYDINRQYIFVDYTGFGDYRLTTPIWDERTRIRIYN